MIGVIIPAHNEERLLDSCLAAAWLAARHPGLQGTPVRLVVVLDGCSDGSENVVLRSGIEALVITACNVGIARATGAAHMIAQGAQWLAFTDADSCVAPDWLVAQLSLRTDAVCGSVQVEDWDEHPARLREIWRERYCDADGHRHVHGANLGVSAQAYQRAGGFPPLTCGEDVALVELLHATGASICWSAAPRVTTSARLRARVRGGFGDTLAAWARLNEPDGVPGLD
jgi:glycosyltransferase involved in cell wall biosynthesis